MSSKTKTWVCASVTAASLLFLSTLITRDVIGRVAAQVSDGPADTPLQSQQALNLKLYRTFMRTQNDQLTLNNIFQSAFDTTTVSCPKTASKGCTLGIRVSCRFDNNSGFETINVVITGAGQPPDPDSSIDVDSLPQGNPEARTFEWMQRSVPASSTETVDVQMQGTGQAADRTEVIDVYTN